MNDSLSFFDIVIISHVKAHLYTANRVVTVIDDVITPDFTVWNDDLLIIKSLHNCCEDIDVFNITKVTTAIDEIANFVRSENHQHNAGRQI